MQISDCGNIIIGYGSDGLSDNQCYCDVYGMSFKCRKMISQSK